MILERDSRGWEEEDQEDDVVMMQDYHREKSLQKKEESTADLDLTSKSSHSEEEQELK
jgi:hypothetical protein